MATRIGGRVHWLRRAVDEYGQTPDVFLQAHRDTAAAERFFRRLLAAIGTTTPAPIATDRLGSYAAALARRHGVTLSGCRPPEHVRGSVLPGGAASALDLDRST
jgi:transposase-like protein